MRHKKRETFGRKQRTFARESPTYLSKTRRQQPEIAKKQPEDQSVSRSSGCCVEWKRTAALMWCGKSAPGGVGRPFVRLHAPFGRLREVNLRRRRPVRSLLLPAGSRNLERVRRFRRDECAAWTIRRSVRGKRGLGTCVPRPCCAPLD